jgi:hypothetical protein
VKVAPMRGRVLEHWRGGESYLLGSTGEDLPEAMRRHEATGRPLGSRPFLKKLEALPGRTLLPRKRGVRKCPRRGEELSVPE